MRSSHIPPSAYLLFSRQRPEEADDARERGWVAFRKRKDHLFSCLCAQIAIETGRPQKCQTKLRAAASSKCRRRVRLTTFRRGGKEMLLLGMNLLTRRAATPLNGELPNYARVRNSASAPTPFVKRHHTSFVKTNESSKRWLLNSKHATSRSVLLLSASAVAYVCRSVGACCR